MKKKRIINITVMLICFVVIICLVPLPLRINRSLDGILWEDGNSQLMEKCTISVNG